MYYTLQQFCIWALILIAYMYMHNEHTTHVSSGARCLIFALGLYLYPNFASNLRCCVRISYIGAHGFSKEGHYHSIMKQSLVIVYIALHAQCRAMCLLRNRPKQLLFYVTTAASRSHDRDLKAPAKLHLKMSPSEVVCCICLPTISLLKKK